VADESKTVFGVVTKSMQMMGNELRPRTPYSLTYNVPTRSLKKCKFEVAYTVGASASLRRSEEGAIFKTK
jgi:hypothetical protein